MNIVVSDSWLREYLETQATPEQIKEYLSLCGPSVERINKVGKEIVYDIEITTNRPDSMSIVGVAREAVAILPRFGIQALLKNDPYTTQTKEFTKMYEKAGSLTVEITTDPIFNPRWTSIIIENVKVSQSPVWVKKRLEQVGIRSLNNVIDTTNYIMHALGQPVHAFDYDSIKPNRAGIAKMALRLSQRDEKITTLDGKTHTLPGGDIVIEDGSGRLIDLCGIMGGENSSISTQTTKVILFMQTYDPVRIRKTQMTLSHHSEAGSLFEKGLDPQLVLPAFIKGVELMLELTGGKVASQLYDIYPKPFISYSVSLKKYKLANYMSENLKDQDIKACLTALGFTVNTNSKDIRVTVPSYRADVTLDVDLVEEVARIYGYHNIKNRLPDTEPPVTYHNSGLDWENEVKIRLRDWGFTEVYTYSMISEKLMDIFELDKKKAYKITNPLSSEWVFLRPHVFPGVMEVVKQNLAIQSDLKLFELGTAYEYRDNDLPLEVPTLILVWTGRKFLEAKGLAEELFNVFGIEFPKSLPTSTHRSLSIYTDVKYELKEYGSLGEINPQLLSKLGIRVPITLLYLNFSHLVKSAQPKKPYVPISKYPPVIEDLTFTLPPKTPKGHVLQSIKNSSTFIDSVELVGTYENAVSFRIYYLNRGQPISQTEVADVRARIVKTVGETFSGTLKGQLKS